MAKQAIESKLKRRTFLKATGGGAATGLLAGCTESGSGGDQAGNNGNSDWPTEEIELVVPYGTSGGYNAYTRLVAKYMPNYLPTKVRVQNIEGASGRVGTNQVYNAEPDGYTNQIVNVQSFVRQQIIFSPDYDMTKMTWYPQIASNKRAIGVGTNTNIKTWEQFVEATKAGKLKFGATGPASGGSVVPFTVGKMSGLYSADKVIDNVVSFDGKGGTIKAIKSGDVQVMAGSISSVLPFVESGDVRLLLVTTWDKKSELAPDVPTLKTKGIKKGEQISNMVTSLRIFAGPPDIPKKNANILREAFTKAIKSKDLQKEAKKIDRPIVYADSETSKKKVQSAFEKWKENSNLLEKVS